MQAALLHCVRSDSTKYTRANEIEKSLQNRKEPAKWRRANIMEKRQRNEK